MMAKDVFTERRQALEGEFFYCVDEKLLSVTEGNTGVESKHKQLESVSGIKNADLLEELVATGASTTSIAAISLVPLALVAWADGAMNHKKQLRFIEAAEDHGIEPGSPARMLLQHWLASKPTVLLETAWQHYVSAIIKQMGSESRDTLRSNIVGRASDIAKASGRELGFGAISAAEHRVIAELEQTFSL